MRISEIVTAAGEHGLESPRVMPYRTRTGEIMHKLYFGPRDERRDVVISATATSEELGAILAGARTLLPAA